MVEDKGCYSCERVQRVGYGSHLEPRLGPELRSLHRSTADKTCWARARSSCSEQSPPVIASARQPAAEGLLPPRLAAGAGDQRGRGPAAGCCGNGRPRRGWCLPQCRGTAGAGVLPAACRPGWGRRPSICGAGWPSPNRADVSPGGGREPGGGPEPTAGRAGRPGGRSSRACRLSPYFDELADHVLAGAPADLFLAADPIQLDRLQAAGLLLPQTRTIFAANSLVAVTGVPSRLPCASPPTCGADRPSGPGGLDLSTRSLQPGLFAGGRTGGRGRAAHCRRRQCTGGPGSRGGQGRGRWGLLTAAMLPGTRIVASCSVSAGRPSRFGMRRCSRPQPPSRAGARPSCNS